MSQIDLVLASASPRRSELLGRLGLRLAIQPADIDETPLAEETPGDYVRRMAREKCEKSRTTVQATEPTPILAADTIVVIDGEILGKPNDPEEAATMLGRLAGRRHDVTTAYCADFEGRKLERSVTTGVAVRLLAPEEIRAYVDSGEWRGKAGGYAIQGIASVFISEIRGSITNVIGLPICEVIADVRALGALADWPPAAFGQIA